jgi:hypothetical protein
MQDERQIIMKNGRPATTGTCSVCGTKMFKIGGGGGGARPKVKPKKAAKKKKSAKKGKSRRR